MIGWEDIFIYKHLNQSKFIKLKSFLEHEQHCNTGHK
jgi:hypothetical protein